jgi:hypothetical protein
MTSCLDHRCKRDVPHAPSTPRRVGIVCAHVRPDGLPCVESPRFYDEETIAVVEGELAFWAPELRFDGDVALATSAPSPPDAGPVRPPVTGATITRVDAKGDFIIDAVAGAPASYAGQLAKSGPQPTIAIPAEPANPRPKRAKKAARAKAEEDFDPDDWEP